MPTGRRPLGRRALLLTALVSAGVPPGPARAQQKMSPQAAQYQDQPRGGLSCLACTFFRPPGACQVVDGTISPHGWCKLFDMPD